MTDQPPNSPLLTRVLATVVRGCGEVRLLHFETDKAAIELYQLETFVLFTWDATRAEELSHRLQKLMTSPHVTGSLTVGLVGGSDQAWRVLRTAKPTITQAEIGLLHIDDNGQIRNQNADLVKMALVDFERVPTPSPEEWARFLDHNAATLAEHANRPQTAAEFAGLLRARQAVATQTLAGLLLAVFGLEFAFGGTQSPPVLLRMGALAPERVLDGEIWRLVSCTFLHSGPMHLFFNTLVLWVLGNSLERVMGTGRFLILYGLSCLGGSLVSLAFLDGFSVGASGGLWGLLGAEAALAWRSKGLLHESMISTARRTAAINLGINLLNSFRPHVDIWAHFGGGAVGAALLLSGVLTRGLPRLGERAATGLFGDADEPSAIPNSQPIRVAAGVVVVTFLLGLSLSLITGQPWTLQSPVEHQRADLPTLGFSLRLPEGLEQASDSSEEIARVRVGDLLADPGAVLVSVYPGNLTDEAVVATEHAALAEALRKVPSGSRLVAGPEDVQIAGKRGLTVIYKFDNDAETELAFVFLAEALVKVEALRWPAFGGAVPQGYAARILDSLQPL